MGRRGGDKLFKKEKEEQKKADIARKKASIAKKIDILIACEDTVSAPEYFKLMVKPLLDNKIITPDSFVIATPHHTDPKGVLDDLKNHVTTTGKTYKNFTHKWIVIDRDKEKVNGGGHTKENFNEALNSAKRYNIEVAYSNDSFELWYLLHFNYLSTPLTRDEINKRLIQKLKTLNTKIFVKLTSDNIKTTTYTKHIYNELLSKRDDAIKHASKLLSSYSSHHIPADDNPSTTVHKLVQIIQLLNSPKEQDKET